MQPHARYRVFGCAAVIQGPADGWASPPILALFAVSCAAAAAFVAVERHSAEPLLGLRFFRSLPFTGASVIAVLSFTVLAGFLFVITLYLQQTRGDSPLRAALGGAALLGLSPATSAVRLAVALAVLGAGLGLVNPPITNTGVTGMPPEQAGVASAVISSTRQLGVAVMGAVAGFVTTSARARASAAAVAGGPE